MTIPRSQNHLAELLGISKAAASRLVQRGMPTDTLEAAQEWRKQNLDPARIKGTRADKYYQPKPSQNAQNAIDRASLVMQSCGSAMEGGKGIDSMVPTLRVFLAAVPPQWRDLVLLHPGVMDLLTDTANQAIMAWCDHSDVPRYANEPMSDAEAQEMGEFWYQVAAGELAIREPDL